MSFELFLTIEGSFSKYIFLLKDLEQSRHHIITKFQLIKSIFLKITETQENQKLVQDMSVPKQEPTEHALWRRFSKRQERRPQNQPLSLPSDLNDKMLQTQDEELKRLNELKAMVMKECEQLLLHRDLLRRDVVMRNQTSPSTHVANHHPSLTSCLSTPVYNGDPLSGGSLSLDASFRFQPAGEPTTQQLQELGSTSKQQQQKIGSGIRKGFLSPSHHAFSTLTKAYKVSLYIQNF